MMHHNAIQALSRWLTMSDALVAAKIGGGPATAEEIGHLLLEFSPLYRMFGGPGITFTKTNTREPAFA